MSSLEAPLHAVLESVSGARAAALLGLDGMPVATVGASGDLPVDLITASYADLAGAAGNPAAVRAAGGAMAHNPLPLVIPCHRVLRSDGSIGGFSSTEGVRQKRRLLALEGAPQPA